MRYRTRRLLLALTVLSAPMGAPVGAQARSTPLLERVLRAEDARASGSEGVIPLLEGLRSTDPIVRRVAIRAVGRLQRPQFVETLAFVLNDAVPRVRSAAANAIAQSVASVPKNGRGLDSARSAVRGARELLLARLAVEGDAMVAGVIARSVGRLPYMEAAQLAAEETGILGAMRRLGGRSALPDSAMFDMLHGLNDVAKARRARNEPSPEITDRLRWAVASSRDVRVRRLAMTALVPAGGVDTLTLSIARRDADPDVRRGVIALASALTPVDRDSLVRWALRDPSPRVRFAAFRLWRQGNAAPECAPVIAATRDPEPMVALGAIDALGGVCVSIDARVARLKEIVETLPMTDGDRVTGKASWHPAAHAFVALARADRVLASPLLPRFVGHRRAQVREYAARAATILRDTTALSVLLTDANHNVQEQAIIGMSQVRAHTADPAYIQLLGSSGYQVVMAAASALSGSKATSAPAAILDALERLTAQKRENTRDARMALLTRVQEIGTPPLAGRLERYLTDYDSTVAMKAASVIGGWTGKETTAFPVPLPIRAEPLPRVFAAKEILLRITMRESSGGGVIVIKLFPDEAPATVARLVRLARDHYFDGLTFHRVEPNFVLQGGSPGANEYVGDAAFMRDELALRSHTRGTIGISTRGRDTGDGQFFVNLVDNIRLDHEYTVVGEIIQGMNVADGVLEGDVMAKVEVIERDN
jgi:cyclophilin family peptidyl-prolyl cis-trans isomerase